MKRRFYSISNMILGSLIAMLGLCACKSAKHAVKEIECVYGPPPGYEERLRERQKQQDLEKARQDSLLMEQQRRQQELKVVYGPPPAYLK